MSRSDISSNLTHFTKGASDEEAFGHLCNMIDQRKILGGIGHIRGGHRCVCFTEAPLVDGGLVNPAAYSRYKPFGLMFTKATVFAQGGRPAIYQSDAEYDLLGPEHCWRHVRYEPDQQIDFTWEREWRLQTEVLSFNEATAVVVVPNVAWAAALRGRHESREDWQVHAYSQIMSNEEAQLLRARFGWKVLTLG